MNQKTMTMALPSHRVSINSSHPTVKPPINYGHHGQDLTTLQKAKQQLACKTFYWLTLVFALTFLCASIQSTPKFRTYPHNFDSSSCQKHPFPQLLLIPLISSPPCIAEARVTTAPASMVQLQLPPRTKNPRNAALSMRRPPQTRRPKRRPFK